MNVIVRKRKKKVHKNTKVVINAKKLEKRQGTKEPQKSAKHLVENVNCRLLHSQSSQCTSCITKCRQKEYENKATIDNLHLSAFALACKFTFSPFPTLSLSLSLVLVVV